MNMRQLSSTALPTEQLGWRARWPPEGEECVRRVIAAHTDWYEVVVPSPHHPSCSQKSTQEYHSQLGRQPLKVLTPRVTGDLVPGPPTHNSSIILRPNGPAHMQMPGEKLERRS